MWHSRRIQCLVVTIVLRALSRLHHLPNLVNVLLIIHVGREGREDRLVYLFIFLKLLERFPAFDLEFFYAPIFKPLQYAVSLAIPIVRVVENHTILVRSHRGIIFDVDIRVAAYLMLVRGVVILLRFLARIVSVLYTNLLTKGNYWALKRRSTSVHGVCKLHFRRITRLNEIHLLQ